MTVDPPTPPPPEDFTQDLLPATAVVAADGERPDVPGYELLDVLGAGGMGAVYRARDGSLKRDLAVKVLHGRLRAEPRYRRRFVEEAQITGQLQHPGVPPVHELGELADGTPFLAMKLVKGRTLADLLRE